VSPVWCPGTAPRSWTLAAYSPQENELACCALPSVVKFVGQLHQQASATGIPRHQQRDWGVRMSQGVSLPEVAEADSHPGPRALHHNTTCAMLLTLTATVICCTPATVHAVTVHVGPYLTHWLRFAPDTLPLLPEPRTICVFGACNCARLVRLVQCVVKARHIHCMTAPATARSSANNAAVSQNIALLESYTWQQAQHACGASIAAG
jgi:hypothetical protein